MPEPEFVPKPGQIDYTHVRRAPVVNCIVRHGDRILLVRRSDDLKFYPGFWNGVSGFLDDDRGPREKARDELKEELGLDPSHITHMVEGEVFEQEESKYDKVWIVHPMLVDVDTEEVTLDWEGSAYAWLALAEIGDRPLLPGFGQVLKTFFPDYNR